MITSLPIRLIFSIIGSSADGLAYGIDAACQWHSCAMEVVSNWANHSKVVPHHWNIPLKDKRNKFHPNSLWYLTGKDLVPPKQKQCGEGPKVVPDPWNIPLKDQPNLVLRLQKPLGTPRSGRPRCHVQHLLRRQLGLGQRHHHHQVLRGAVGRRQGGAASVLRRKGSKQTHRPQKTRGKTAQERPTKKTTTPKPWTWPQGLGMSQTKIGGTWDITPTCLRMVYGSR